MSVWWPGLAKQLANFIEKCPECARDSKPTSELLIPTSLPDYPWQKVTADIFKLILSHSGLFLEISRSPEAEVDDDSECCQHPKGSIR